MDDKLPGSGPYPAAYFTDPSLPKHTIYAPKSPPKDIKLPVLLWGNGGCAAAGVLYQNFLREIASHGFIVLANGSPTGWADPQTKPIQMTQSIEWVTKGGADGKFGTPDASKIASSGQSCGGLEAYAAAYHDPRVKTAIICNSGVLDDEKAYLLKEFKVPIVYFIGGPKDIAYKNVRNVILPPFR
jgi:dipeptidyl aminopeptidase/acylaminoacyl peptidase